MTTDAQGSFAARKVASTGHEVIDPSGNVIAWTVDGHWADIIVALLNRVERHGLGDLGPHAAGGMVAMPDSKDADAR